VVNGSQVDANPAVVLNTCKKDGNTWDFLPVAFALAEFEFICLYPLPGTGRICFNEIGMGSDGTPDRNSKRRERGF